MPRRLSRSVPLLAVAAALGVTAPAVGAGPLPTAEAAAPLTSEVNPFVGTQDNGNTFPGPSAPFGMVQVSPDTGGEGGYDYSQSLIHGFSQTHLSGVGCPVVGEPPGHADDGSGHDDRLHGIPERVHARRRGGDTGVLPGGSHEVRHRRRGSPRRTGPGGSATPSRPGSRPTSCSTPRRPTARSSTPRSTSSVTGPSRAGSTTATSAPARTSTPSTSRRSSRSRSRRSARGRARPGRPARATRRPRAARTARG